MRKPRILGDRILVKVKKDIVDEKFAFNPLTRTYDEKSDSGVVIKCYNRQEIDNLRLGTQEAYVMQVGRNAYKSIGDGHAWVKVGDLVTMNRWSGEVLPDIGDGEIYRIVQDEDLFVAWEGEELNDR